MAVIAVAGHRPPRVGGYRIPNPVQQEICNLLAQQLVTLSPELVLIGMAIGVDQWTAEICIEEGIPWDAIIPFHGYERQWPPHAQQHYRQLLAYANSQHVVTNTHAYNSNLLYRRNAWMVDHSDMLLAVWNRQPSGTANAVEYAQRRGKQVRIVPVDQATWDLAERLGQEDGVRRSQWRQSQAAIAAATNPNPVPAPLLSQPAAEEPLQAVTDRIRRSLEQRFVGQRVTPEILAQMREAAMRQLEALRAFERNDDLHPSLEDLLPEPTEVPLEGEDRTTTAAAEDAHEPVPEPAKEIISPEKRFRPGRVIHLDEEE